MLLTDASEKLWLVVPSETRIVEAFGSETVAASLLAESAMLSIPFVPSVGTTARSVRSSSISMSSERRRRRRRIERSAMRWYGKFWGFPDGLPGE